MFYFFNFVWRQSAWKCIEFRSLVREFEFVENSPEFAWLLLKNWVERLSIYSWCWKKLLNDKRTEHYNFIKKNNTVWVLKRKVTGNRNERKTWKLTVWLPANENIAVLYQKSGVFMKRLCRFYANFYCTKNLISNGHTICIFVGKPALGNKIPKSYFKSAFQK